MRNTWSSHSEKLSGSCASLARAATAASVVTAPRATLALRFFPFAPLLVADTGAVAECNIRLLRGRADDAGLHRGVRLEGAAPLLRVAVGGRGSLRQQRRRGEGDRAAAAAAAAAVAIAVVVTDSLVFALGVPLAKSGKKRDAGVLREPLSTVLAHTRGLGGVLQRLLR